MGWLEFVGWLGVLKEHNEAKEVAPGSWAGADQDPWWVEQRQRRAEERRR